MVKLGKYKRSVSIIGVGCTPFMQHILDNPETNGLTEGELLGYAALEAMQDAGIESKDIDFFIHGEAFPAGMSDYVTPAAQIMDWAGMRGKGAMHHSEACCTGYLALEAAVDMVASGKSNIVLSGCVEMCDTMPIIEHPYKRRDITTEEVMMLLDQIYDRSYSRTFGSAKLITVDSLGSRYVKEHGLTDEQMDDVLNAMAISCRRGAARNPRAVHQKEYAELAKENGFGTAEEFLKSPFNPKLSKYIRVSGWEQTCSGAAAVIVCPTEMAGRFKQTPIEVLGIGNSTIEGATPYLEHYATAEACRQVYELTGVKPEELDLFFANDFIITSHLAAAEIAGYLPADGWKYALEGRTAFDGDKPINTNGGRTSFGHAYGASGCADYYEAVKQMRGQCGDRQVKKLPKTTMLRGFGGGQNVCATILRTVE